MSVSDDSRVCSTRGVHLGDVTLVLDYSCSDGYEEERANANNRLDHFLEHVCKQTQVDKQDIVGEIFRIFNRSGHPEFRENKGKMSAEDLWMKMTRTIVNDECFTTSRGLILILDRIDELPREGDVLVLLKGANYPWLLRPMVESNAEIYTFVGACVMLYSNPRSSGMKDWPSNWWPDVPEEILGHFFESNDVREFRLV